MFRCRSRRVSLQSLWAIVKSAFVVELSETWFFQTIVPSARFQTNRSWLEHWLWKNQKRSVGSFRERPASSVVAFEQSWNSRVIKNASHWGILFVPLVLLRNRNTLCWMDELRNVQTSQTHVYSDWSDWSFDSGCHSCKGAKSEEKGLELGSKTRGALR